MLTLASVVDGSQSMTKSHFGLIGLGVMGENLVLNAERNGFSSVVYNRTYSKTEDFLKGPLGTAGNTHTDEAKALAFQLLHTAFGVLIIGVATIN